MTADVVDLAVVGAGPAGAAAALRALQLRPDARVLLLDRDAFPRDKACGDAIAAGVVAELARLDVHDAVDGYAVVPELIVTTPGGGQVRGRPRGGGWVVPRTVFDARLVAAAVERGAVLVQHTLHALRDRGDAVVLDGQFAARTVVAADGANSTVRRLLGIAANPDSHQGIAVRGYAPRSPEGSAPERALRVTLVTDGWPAYVWSFPIDDDTANVGYGMLRSRLRRGRAELHERLARMQPGEPADPGTLRVHHLPFCSHRPAPASGRVLLAGDAASLVNPLTGQGIFTALRSGALAGEAAVNAGTDPGGAYALMLKAELGRLLRAAPFVARAVRHAPLAEAAVVAASRSTRAFDDLVALGLGGGGAIRTALVATAWAYPGALAAQVARRRVDLVP